MVSSRSLVVSGALHPLREHQLSIHRWLDCKKAKNRVFEQIALWWIRQLLGKTRFLQGTFFTCKTYQYVGSQKYNFNGYNGLNERMLINGECTR